MGYIIITSAYINTFKHTLDTKACPRLCAIAIIVAPTTIISI
jgi:hypothetical protein